MQHPSSKAGQQLTERKRIILRNVIQHYVAEVHPVSSASVARDINVSSATVRNELAMLEEQGFLRQLHTSGGRVPTDQAYRFLVEELLGEVTETLSQRARVADVYRQLGRETEALLEGTLDLLAQMTGYVAWVSMPESSVLTIRNINFVEIDHHELLLVLVTGSGTLQSKVVKTELSVSELNLGKLTEKLNNYFRGKAINDIDYPTIQAIFHEVVEVPNKLVSTIEDFFSSLAASTEKVVFGNALQLALQPEFSRMDTLGTVLKVLDDQDRFISLLREQLKGGSIQTIIGTENADKDLHDCSLVVSSYNLPGQAGEGTVGIIGPTRQVYQRTLPMVQVVGEAIAKVLWEFNDAGTNS